MFIPFSFDPKKSCLTDAASIRLLPLNERLNGVARSVFSSRSQDLEAPPLDSSIEHCPMNGPEIQRESLLNTADLDPIPDLGDGNSQESTLFKIAANFLGGGLVTGGDKKIKLDGLGWTPNFRTWKWLLEDLKKSVKPQAVEESVIDSLIKGIKQLEEFSEDLVHLHSLRGPFDVHKGHELRSCASKYAERIQKLKEGEFLLISGGWKNEASDSGSHAVVYEFSRKSNGLYDICLFTSTHFDLADTISIGEKVRLKSVVRYSGIPQRMLCFDDDGKVRPVFIQHLIENFVLAKWDLNLKMDEEDVLKAFDYLAEYRVDVGWDEEGAITPQRGGTCNPSSTKAWMRHRCQHLALYKQIWLHLAMRLIISLYRMFKDNSLQKDDQAGAYARRILEQAARNFLRDLQKGVSETYGNGPILDADLARQFQATAYHILKEVASLEKEIRKERQKQFTLCDFFRCDFEEQRRIRAQFPFLSTSLPKAFSDIERQPVPNFKCKIVSFYDCHQYIHSVLPNLKESRVLNRAIHFLVDQLPLPQAPGTSLPFWNHLKQEELETAIQDLEQIAACYGKVIDQDSPTRCHATLFALHALTHYLALLYEQGRIEEDLAKENPEAILANYRLPPVWRLANQLEGLTYYDRKEYERIQQSVAYFESFNRKACYEPLFHSERNTEVIQSKIKSKENVEEVRGQYWKALLEQDKALFQKIEKEANRRWPDLTEDVIERRYRWEIYQKEMQEYELLCSYLSNPDKCKGPPPKAVHKPTELLREVNLPSQTKRLMILEEAVSLGKDNPLSRSGYAHIPYLRAMTHRMNLCMHEKSFGFKLNAKAERNSPPILGLSRGHLNLKPSSTLLPARICVFTFWNRSTVK